jgi:uncharacterized membrane protein
MVARQLCDHLGGGAFIMVILGMAAERARDDNDMVFLVRKVAWAAERVYVPSSILTLLFGLLATWLAALWSELWVILGLVGIAATIALGIAVLTPRAKKVEAGYASGGVSPPVVATCREILAIAKFDLVLLFTIVATMVLKPQPADWVVLLIMAIVVVGAGVLFLRPRKASAVPA